MRLRSIPPANRTLSRLSSMRAATRVGMTFVGGHVGPAAQPSQQGQFKAATVEPDKVRIKALQEYRAAIRQRVQWLEDQALAAANPEEEAWWRSELTRVGKP
jgi:hypothetical protein